MSDQLENLKSLESIQSAEALERTITVTRKKTVKGEHGTETVKSVEENVFVRPLVFSQWLKGLTALRGIAAAIPDAEFNLGDPAHLALFIGQILADAQSDVLAVAAMAINRDPSYFDEIELDEAFKLFKAVFEVNRDFFTRKLMPMIAQVAPDISEKIQVVTNQVGQTE